MAPRPGSDKRIDSRKSRTPGDSLQRSMELSPQLSFAVAKAILRSATFHTAVPGWMRFCNDDIRPFLQLVYEVRRALHHEEEASMNDNNAEFHF